MTSQSFLLLGVFLVGSLAGCMGASPSQDAGGPAPPPAAGGFTGTMGSVTGLVTDEESIPLVGAQVGVVELDRATVTDEEGRFVLPDLPAGRHLLQAQRLGYAGATQWIDLAADDAHEVEIQLVRLPSLEPHVVTQTQRGLFGCGASWRPGLPPEPAPAVAGRVSGVAACGLVADTPADPYDKFLLVWSFEADTSQWETGVFEMAWRSSQLAGRGLRVLWEVDLCYSDPGFRFADESGASPLVGRADSSVIQSILYNATDPASTAVCTPGPTPGQWCNASGCRLVSRVFSESKTTGRDADLGVALQQPFDQYHSAFFGAPAPAEYSAAADAA